jgi:hypothetical protein
VGFARKRTAHDGTSRYAAVYPDARGQVRQAGTFSTKKDANLAWQRAEVAVSSGRPGDPRRGRVTVAAYVNEEWFPNHVMEPSTREEYRYCLDRHILPWFGNMKMADILPTHVRQWVTELVAQGSAVARLFLEVEIGSGLRWGELTELRARDLQLDSGILTITRTVSEVNPKYHPTGGRFYVKPYPKSKHSRRLKLDPDLVDAIAQHNRRYDTGLDDLIFRYLQFSPTPATLPALVDAETLGLTDPTSASRRYQHGTLSAYTAGGCRCEHCKATTSRAEPGPVTPTDTCHATGSDTESGSRPANKPDSIRQSGCTTLDTHTHPGCSPAGPTSKSSANASATPASPPPANTYTPSPRPTTPPSLRCGRSDRPSEIAQVAPPRDVLARQHGGRGECNSWRSCADRPTRAGTIIGRLLRNRQLVVAP